jgi:hypothetical protein
MLTGLQSEMRQTPTAMVSPPRNILRPNSNAPTEEPEAGQKEVFTSWALSILITLLIVALFTSYILQTRKIQAVHETVLSIFAGTRRQCGHKPAPGSWKAH